MRELEEYFAENNIFITQNVSATFGKILDKYKFQEIAILGEDVSNLAHALRKDYKVSSVNIPKELCYSLSGLNLARIQLKENTRLVVAFGEQHYLNLAKLIANKLDLAFCYVTFGSVNLYAKTKFAIMDNRPISIKKDIMAIIVDQNANFDIADAYAENLANIFGCFELYLKEKFFENDCEMNIKKLFDTYYEILNIEKVKNPNNITFLIKLNLLQVVQYSKFKGIPFHDNYYLTLQFLSKNVTLFNDFSQILFVFSQMLSLLYDMYFKNELQSPLYMMTDELEKMTTLNEFANAINRQPARNCEKTQYVYNLYIQMISSMTTSYQRLYNKTAFRLKNLMSDSGYQLFLRLDCGKMIQTMKETSLLNPNSLLSLFGITELA